MFPGAALQCSGLSGALLANFAGQLALLIRSTAMMGLQALDLTNMRCCAWFNPSLMQILMCVDACSWQRSTNRDTAREAYGPFVGLFQGPSG